MDIKRAKQEIERTVKAYLARDAAGNYRIPALRQRPILLMGPPGVGKTQIVEQAARECGVALVAYTITHHTRQSAVGLPFIRERNFDGRTRSVTGCGRAFCLLTRSTAYPRRWPPPCCNFCSTRPLATRRCRRAG